MINKIGVELGVNNINRSKQQNSVNFKSELPIQEDINNKQTELISKNAANALSAYNMASLTALAKNRLDIEPLIPIEIKPEEADKIDGERIYSSDGKLFSIVRRDEDTVTEYIPDKDNENMFSTIKIYDKNAKYPVRVQTNTIEDGKYSSVDIVEYDGKTGKILRNTYYDDGKIYSASKYFYERNGRKSEIVHFYEDNQYSLHSTLPNQKDRVHVTFDKNKQIENFYATREANGQFKSTEVSFYNNIPINVDIHREVTIPNSLGSEKYMNIEDLKPAEYFEKIKGCKDFEGQKTYYSNGALESNAFETENLKATAFFKPDGTCYKIVSENKEIEFDDDGKQTIKENLGDNKVKTTILNPKRNYKNVRVEENNTYKEIGYEKDVPTFYSSGTIEDGSDKESECFFYNNAGMLTSAHRY